MIAYETSVGNVTGTFPATTAKNSSTPGATDGTPLVAAMVNNIWGYFQALMNQAGLTPNGVQEEYNASQLLTASQLLFGAAPGDLYQSLVQNPATLGVRALILTGQVITIASYPNLVANTYIGDTNNPNTAYQYFYKCSDAGGSTRSTSGTYYKLPDFRGVFLRGLDIGGTRNPNGTSDFLGNYRADAMQGHWHGPIYKYNGYEALLSTTTATTGTSLGAIGDQVYGTAGNYVGPPITDTVNGAPRIDKESRPMQGIIQIGIRY